MAVSVRSEWIIDRPLPAKPSASGKTFNTNHSASSRGASRSAEFRNAVALMIAILLISVLSLLYMTEAGRLATSGYEIGQLQRGRDALQRDNEALRVELSRLQSLPYIEKVATEKLHMTKGDLSKVQYLSLSERQLAEISPR